MFKRKGANVVRKILGNQNDCSADSGRYNLRRSFASDKPGNITVAPSLLQDGLQLCDTRVTDIHLNIHASIGNAASTSISHNALSTDDKPVAGMMIYNSDSRFANSMTRLHALMGNPYHKKSSQ